MHGEREEEVNSLFFELAGDLRYSTLMKLRNRSYRLSQLAEELNATMQETHRNISRLVSSNLVTKGLEGELLLTPYGESIVSLIPGYAFMFQNREYFNDHTFGDLPLKFIRSIGSLAECEIVNGVMAILQRWKYIFLSSKEYIKEIISEVPVDLIETLGSRIQDGVKFSYIFPRDPVVPKGRSEILERIGWRGLISKGLVERRMLDTVKLVLIFNERQSCVAFPSLKGRPDLNIVYYGDNNEFHEWCEDYFEYQWNRAGVFDESKLSHEI
ncbi:MAG TPA: transcriptional regulator [Nitrososphaeraceae archaeon]|jgi:predicted transcriptional regulator|nr:transcriptional regulator [Nitrososphaeraceae archaeon]